MKKIIFVFGFLLCLAFGAQAKNTNPVKNTIMQVIEHPNLTTAYHVNISKPCRCCEFSITLNLGGGRKITFWGGGDSWEEAILQAVDHWLEWENYGG